MKSDKINGYTLTTDWKVVGGMSEVAFATKGGKEWFIKKFIKPKYPTPDSPGSEKIKAQKRKACEEFETRQKELNNKIGSKCGLGGNLVYAYDFFRVDTLYYKITEKIDVSSVSIEEISRLNHKDLMIILKSLVHSLRIMHRENIVHGDLKPDNILIKATATGSYTTKLIDFDDSYFSGSPSRDKELVVGTPEYYSPELYDYITDEDDEVPGETLTTKSDIFALGVIFAEYLTGSKPIIPDGYSGTYAAVKAGKPVSFKMSAHLTSNLQALLESMLQLDASKRPNIDEVFNALKETSGTSGAPTPTPHPIPTSTDPILKFIAIPSSAKAGDKISLEWDVVEGTTDIRIDGGFPVVRRGKKTYPAKDSFRLTAITPDGRRVERVLNIDVFETEETTIVSPIAGGGSRLRGSGLGIGR